MDYGRDGRQQTLRGKNIVKNREKRNEDRRAREPTRREATDKEDEGFKEKTEKEIKKL
jgi:hypothetical protein